MPDRDGFASAQSGSTEYRAAPRRPRTRRWRFAARRQHSLRHQISGPMRSRRRCCGRCAVNAGAEILFGQRSSVMSLMVSNETKPHHAFDSAEMGAIAHLYRGEVYRSTIWRTRLDNTTNSSNRHNGHRAFDDVFKPGGFAAAVAAGRAAPCGVSRHGGAAISLFQCLARPRALAGDEFLRADVHR